MRLPAARGPLSRSLARRLRTSPSMRAESDLHGVAERAVQALPATTLAAEDVQISLAMLYELHYRGLSGVHQAWEWQPELMSVAAVLETAFERDLQAAVAHRLPQVAPQATEVPRALTVLVDGDDGPSLSGHLARQGTVQHYTEFVMHRSIYHLREADPHTFAIPRLAGRPKAALVEVQADEYGGGHAERMHSTLFAATLRGLGVDDTYGAHIDVVPAVTLAWSNAMTLFGLHRKWRGAVAGHLAALEMTSSLPNRKYGNGLRRIGFDAGTTLFFDEHIEADAVHEQIAAHDLAGQLALDEPDLVPDILLGAAVALELDARVAGHLVSAWSEGVSSLRPPRREIAAIEEHRPPRRSGVA